MDNTCLRQFIVIGICKWSEAQNVFYDKNSRTKEEPKEKTESMHFQSGNIVTNNGTENFERKDECDHCTMEFQLIIGQTDEIFRMLDVHGANGPFKQTQKRTIAFKMCVHLHNRQAFEV